MTRKVDHPVQLNSYCRYPKVINRLRLAGSVYVPKKKNVPESGEVPEFGYVSMYAFIFGTFRSCANYVGGGWAEYREFRFFCPRFLN